MDFQAKMIRLAWSEDDYFRSSMTWGMKGNAYSITTIFRATRSVRAGMPALHCAPLRFIATQLTLLFW